MNAVHLCQHVSWRDQPVCWSPHVHSNIGYHLAQSLHKWGQTQLYVCIAVAVQVMSSGKLPPLLDVGGARYKQMQAALMAMAEPSEYGVWRVKGGG
jgi:hypothetical protein